MPERPRVLIEQWLPIAEIGAECMRERGASSALPPLYFLHVWWARRPLTVSRAAILASLLPAYPNGDESIRPWPKEFLKRFPTEETYHAWFLKLIGIHGDPVTARKLIEWEKRTGRNTPGNKYGYARAFTVNPTEDQLEALFDLLEWTWGTREINFCDPMSGGGSIPFEALRYGLTVHANELNPVASVILKATLEYPARFGPSLADDIRKYGKMWCDRVRLRLKPLYADHPPTPDGSLKGGMMLWARTVICPTTGKPVPLSPNWWLQKSSAPVAVRVMADPRGDRCRFEIVNGKAACEKAKPDQGTIKGGTGRSPWTGEAIDGDYIKAEAQAGRMGQQLYAVEVYTGRSEFRSPDEHDEAAFERAVKELAKHRSGWEAKGLIPTAAITEYSNYDRGHRLYGINRWSDMFNARQLLVLGVMLEESLAVLAECRRIIGEDQTRTVASYFSCAIGKTINYNSRYSVWHPLRETMANTFNKHSFAFCWSHGEYNASRNLLPWAMDQIQDAYKGIATLVDSTREWFVSLRGAPPVQRLSVTQGTAARLADVPDGSLHHICVDPPYGANVMYGELSHYFYVWMRPILRDLFPGLFDSELSSLDDEAVANHARFREMRARKKELAENDYERKMKACFAEMRRALAGDGVLTVMFTHKETESWEKLGSALINAGLTIDSSWPVHTESEHSLHQAKKNAAASTILLVCRKRDKASEPVWWDDLKGKVRRTAREAAERFEKMGISGVDLYISTFGPVLSIISENWPVLTSQTDPKTGDPMPLRPGDALDLARAEVIALRKQGLLLGRAVDFDPVTDWVLMAWDAFKAVEFPADEARKLALALGLDLEVCIVREKKLVAKKQSTVVLNLPTARRKKGMVDPDAESFAQTIDAVHTAMMVYDEDGAKACGVFLTKHGLKNDSRFKACIEALMKAIPTTRDKKGAFVRPEMQTLEALRLAFFDDLPAPKEEEVPQVETQKTLFTMDGSDEDVDEDEDEEGDEE